MSPNATRIDDVSHDYDIQNASIYKSGFQFKRICDISIIGTIWI